MQSVNFSVGTTSRKRSHLSLFFLPSMTATYNGIDVVSTTTLQDTVPPCRHYCGPMPTPSDPLCCCCDNCYNFECDNHLKQSERLNAMLDWRTKHHDMLKVHRFSTMLNKEKERQRYEQTCGMQHPYRSPTGFSSSSSPESACGDVVNTLRRRPRHCYRSVSQNCLGCNTGYYEVCDCNHLLPSQLSSSPSSDDAVNRGHS